MDDLLYEWASLDPDRDAWLVLAGDILVGYGSFSGTGRTPHADFYVTPPIATTPSAICCWRRLSPGRRKPRRR